MRQLLQRAWYLIRHRQFEADLAEEMEFHRSMTTAREFGSAALARNQARDVWIWPWLQDIAQDVRFAVRLLVKDRRFTLAAIVALALGIAANNTVFTFINTALFNELPFERPERVVGIGTRDARGREGSLSYLDFQDWRASARTFAGIAATANGAMSVSDEVRAPERVNGSYVSANAFRLIGREPMAGRSFLPEDERPGAPSVVMLGYGVWMARYGGDAGIVGRAIRINGIPSTVVGIMPDGFRFPGTAEVWQPLPALAGLTGATRDARSLSVLGRMADGVSIEQARTDLSTIAARLARQYPDTNKNITATVAPMLDAFRRFTWPILMTMMGAVVFVLLIACANVASLLLARAANRSREIAIRASLGASRWRIVRQLLIESLLLAALAGGLGLILSLWGVRYFGVAFDASEIGGDRFTTPYWVDLSMNARVFAFLAALCLGSSIVFGLVPALHVSKTNLNDVLKDASRSAAGSLRARRWTGALMIGELALTLVLLAGAGLMARSFVTHYRTNLGIDTSRLVVARVNLPLQKYATADQRKAFLERLNERLGSNPSLASSAIASDMPFAWQGPAARALTVDGLATIAGEPSPEVSSVNVVGRYFDTLGLRIARGRALAASDGEIGHEGAIVNQRFVDMFLTPRGGGAPRVLNNDPLGTRIRLSVPRAAGPPGPWLTIVGVVQTLPAFGPVVSGDPPVVYVPLRTEAAPGRVVSVIVHSASAPAGVAAVTALLRDEVRALDADLPLYAIQTLDDVVARTRYPLRLMGSLFALLALIAVVLSSVGLFALTSHSVAERTQEIGVRMALGAQKAEVVWLFVRRTLAQLAIGLTLGLGGALATGKLLQSFLVRTDARDPVTIAMVVCLLMVVSLVACVIPARRASRIDPVVALRYE
jgi:predicted permease